MPRGRPPGPPEPSEREWDVLAVLWSKGSATVAEVKAELEGQGELDYAYTTVLSLLQGLKSKRWVTTLREGKADRYFATRSLASARDERLTRIRWLLFDGSYDSLLQFIVEDRHLTRPVISRMRRVLARRLIRSTPGAAR